MLLQCDFFNNDTSHNAIGILRMLTWQNDMQILGMERLGGLLFPITLAGYRKIVIKQCLEFVRCCETAYVMQTQKSREESG